MALFKNMVMTQKGMGLYAKAQAGQEIHFTKMQVGSGKIDTQNPVNLIGLINPKLDVPIISIVPRPEAKSATIIGHITNEDVTEATYICEVGLWANDPDEGEILYGYTSSGEFGDYYAPISQGPYSWQYEVAAAIGNATNVTAEFSKLIYDYGVINSNTNLIHLKGRTQKEVNTSIENSIIKISQDINKQQNEIDESVKLGKTDTKINKIKALNFNVDSRNTLLTYTDNMLTKIEEKSGTNVIKSTTLVYEEDVLVKVIEVAENTTVTSTLNYANGQLVGVSKGVS